MSITKLSVILNSIPITATADAESCSVCLNEKECRPYGADGEPVCFDCAMKDEKTTKQQFQKVLNASGLAPGRMQ